MAKNSTPAETVDEEQAEHDALDATETVEEAKEKGPRARYVDYSEWLETEHGLAGLDPQTLQFAVTLYSKFAQSEFNKTRTAERREKNKAEREARSAAYNERRQAAAIKNEEKTAQALERAQEKLRKAQEQAERQAAIARGEVPARKPRKTKAQKEAEQAQEAPGPDGATGEVTFASEGSARVTEVHNADEGELY